MKKLLCLIIPPLSLISFLMFSPLYAQLYFKQISQQANFRYAQNGNGVAAADFNDDGLIDFYYVSESVYNRERAGTANLLFKNNGDGTFVDVAEEAGVQGTDNSVIEPKLVKNYGASWGDFDNDGDVDLYLANRGPDELYENNGDGTFRDITVSAGLFKSFRDATGAAWFDYNKDGYLDLFISAYGEYGADRTQDNVLFHNNGDGTFTDITASTGLADGGYTYATMVVDANYDGWPDLYCSNDFGANRFYLNRRNGTFREATREYGLENDGHGMGVALGDYDNDGRFDIYLTNIAEEGAGDEWNPLFKHMASGAYDDVARNAGIEFAGWGWGVEFFDFDLDGHVDVYAVNGFPGAQTHNYFYHNSGNGTFANISQQSGLASEAEARGLCVADFDNDGRLDCVVANYHQAVAIYFNQSTTGNYLQVELIGTKSNRDARGAIVSAKTENRIFYRPNDGIEFMGQSKVPIHFGLGNATIVDKLTIKWLSGVHQNFYNIPANQTITINEDLGITTGVKERKASEPQNFTLLKNYPNPLRDRTSLRFQIASRADIKLEIFDLLGRLVAIPINRNFLKGEHNFAWDGKDWNGHPLASGIYIQRLSSGAFTAHRKLIIVR